MLGALDTLGSLTINPSHLRALDEQLQWIDELANRCIEATHDRARIKRQLSEVRETLQAQSALCAEEENV
jgi:hypothetical protein